MRLAEGIAVRPVLAAWLADAHRSDRITVKGLRGRPRSVSFSQWLEAIRSVEKLFDEGLEVDKAIATTRKQMRLKISRETVHSWLREMRDIRAADHEESFLHSKAIAMAEFGRLRNEGLSATAALRRVERIRDWPSRPARQALELWQHEEEHGPLDEMVGATLTKLPWF